MDVPKPFRLLVEDFDDAPTWFGRLVTPLNRFNEETIAVLDQGVSFRTQIPSVQFQTNFTTSATYTAGTFDPITYAWTFNELPNLTTVAQIFKADNTLFLGSVGTPQWFYASRSINIQYVPGLANSTKYVIKFLSF